MKILLYALLAVLVGACPKRCSQEPVAAGDAEAAPSAVAQAAR